jgi:protein transport protein SEC24
MRLDQLQRPELNKGTIDFVVSEEYWANNTPPKITSSYVSMNPSPTPTTRRPETLHYVFAFDVSADSVESGFLKSSCDALLALLFEGNAEGVAIPCFIPGCKIAIISFDQSLHFYNLSVRLQLIILHIELSISLASSRRRQYTGCTRPRRGLRASLPRPFCRRHRISVRAEFFRNSRSNVNIGHRAVIQRLLEALPRRHAETTMRQSALGSALSACLASLVRLNSRDRISKLIARSGRPWRTGRCLPSDNSYYRPRCA